MKANEVRTKLTENSNKGAVKKKRTVTKKEDRNYSIITIIFMNDEHKIKVENIKNTIYKKLRLSYYELYLKIKTDTYGVGFLQYYLVNKHNNEYKSGSFGCVGDDYSHKYIRLVLDNFSYKGETLYDIQDIDECDFDTREELEGHINWAKSHHLEQYGDDAEIVYNGVGIQLLNKNNKYVYVSEGFDKYYSNIECFIIFIQDMTDFLL